MTFTLIGVLAWALSPVERGDATNMAAGYFPAVLGCLLAGVGLLLIARSVKSVAAGDGPVVLAPRPFFVLPAVVAFALLFERAGLVVASLALLVIAAFAARGLTVRQFLVVTAVLVALVFLIFVWGLGLPVKVWPG